MTMQKENLVVCGDAEHWLLTSKSVAYVGIKRAMPCTTILVHGVNDVGEAFASQEQGICAGLNKRLFRDDICPGDWVLPPVKDAGEKYTAADIHPDPDKVYFQRKPDQGTSPIIPFYWGYRERTEASNTKERHGQYLDRHGNRLDKRFAKNGGPFANATTNIPDMFGPGFQANWVIRRVDPKDATHPLKTAPPRRYMVLAAKRLAALIRIIRKNSPNEPINIVAHSQGCFVTLLAHAFLAKDGNGIKADTVILNNPPYSVDEPFIETFQTTSAEQQTTHAREETLRKLVADYITSSPAAIPSFSELKVAGEGAVGREWMPTEHKERDNRGKLYLYFSPDDATVGLPNIQGIGWWGVYPELLPRLGPRFYQRLFASQNGKNRTAPPVGSEPYTIDLKFVWNVLPTLSRTRRINAEALENTFKPDLGAAILPNGVLDAAIATTHQYDTKGKEGMRPDESPEDAQARWLNDHGANSFHSGIVTNPMHSENATARDMCIGLSAIHKSPDARLITFLRAVADWRTTWSDGGDDVAMNDPSFPMPPVEIVAMLKDNNIITSDDQQIVTDNFNYYSTKGTHPGLLPESILTCAVKSLAPFIISETRAQATNDAKRESGNYGG